RALPDDEAIGEGEHHQVTRRAQVGAQPLGDDGLVEDVRPDAVEHALVAWPHALERDGHQKDRTWRRLPRMGIENIAGPLTMRFCASIVLRRRSRRAACSTGGSAAMEGSRKYPIR